MGKSPNRTKIVERFLNEPDTPGLSEVLPLIPVGAITKHIYERYEVSVHPSSITRYEQLSDIAAVCETLTEEGIKPPKYDVHAWFNSVHASLEGCSPLRACLNGDTEAVIEFAKHTAQRAKELAR